MQGVIFDGAVKVVRDLPEPGRPAGEATIAMRLAGVCDTDLQIVRGYMGYRGVLGHEFVGEVTWAENPSWLGRRVVGDINAGCGACEDCVTRDGHHCATRTVLGIAGRPGAMAERFAIPVRNLVAVPDSVPDRAAVFAEPLAAALHVIDALPPVAGSVAVVGDGKLGLLVCAALRSTGMAVTAFGHHAGQLAVAEAWGAQTVNVGASPELGHPRYEAVVEASGTRSGLELAMSLVAPRGTIVLKTTVSGRYEVDLAPLVINEVRLVGSRCGDLRKAIAALASGAIDPTPLIEAEYPLSRGAEAIAHAGRRGSRKILVVKEG